MSPDIFKDVMGIPVSPRDLQKRGRFSNPNWLQQTMGRLWVQNMGDF